MKNINRGCTTKVAAAVKFFFTGDEESFYHEPSSAKRLSIEELDKVAGGDGTATDAYLRELCRKYGTGNKLDALNKATEEEFLHHIELF